MTQRRQRQLITVRSLAEAFGALSVALVRVRVSETTSPEVGRNRRFPKEVSPQTNGARPSRAIAGNGRERVNFLFSTAIADAAKEKSLPAKPERFSGPEIRTVLLPEVRRKTQAGAERNCLSGERPKKRREEGKEMSKLRNLGEKEDPEKASAQFAYFNHRSNGGRR
jgi:hypothetical protein